MRRIIFALLLGVAPGAWAATLTVAVAANVQYAFSEIAAAFTQETGHEIKPIYNSSGKITAQVMHGAPFDVFLSADMEYPETLHQAGQTVGAPKAYAHGALVLWTMHNELDLENWQATLASNKVRRIAISNPKVAPYGRETIKLLAHFKLDEALKPKLVYGESVSQTNQYIHSRSVSAGFTAKSVVMAPEMAGQGKWIALPPDSYQPIAQGIVVLRHAQKSNLQLARAFQDFVLSEQGRAVLARYGYLLP
jgi:molybdate transport system substrate-binding protein